MSNEELTSWLKFWSATSAAFFIAFLLVTSKYYETERKLIKAQRSESSCKFLNAGDIYE